MLKLVFKESIHVQVEKVVLKMGMHYMSMTKIMTNNTKHNIGLYDNDTNDWWQIGSLYFN